MRFLLCCGLLLGNLESCADLFSHAKRQLDSVASPVANDVFERYLQSSYPIADGFDFPVGDKDAQGSYIDRLSGKKHTGWYVATRFGQTYRLGIHPGEDFNGRGGGNTDLGQPVYAIGCGKVTYAHEVGGLWGKVVMIEHTFYENHLRRTIQSVYVHLNQMNVENGQIVKRRQQVGTIGRDQNATYQAHLHLEIRLSIELPATYWPSSDNKDLAWIQQHYLPPSDFIRSHRRLFVPSDEDHLVLVDHETYRMRYLQKGKPIADYEVAFGQAKGQKQCRGDLKTPKGMYFVVHKKKGHFAGKFGAYFGGHWIKINYPNAFDAQIGLEQKWINATQFAQIKERWEKRQSTLEDTKLGGGIGFHGWIEEWDDRVVRHLSWGCIVMHNRDIETFWPKVPKGTMVVIF